MVATLFPSNSSTIVYTLTFLGGLRIPYYQMNVLSNSSTLITSTS